MKLDQAQKYGPVVNFMKVVNLEFDTMKTEKLNA
jgi:hypothetical protein